MSPEFKTPPKLGEPEGVDRAFANVLFKKPLTASFQQSSILINNMNDVAWYALGAVAAALTSFGFVPQIVKMWRSKSVRDVSPLMIVQFIAGGSLWVVYGVHLNNNWVIIAANLVSLTILITALLLYFRLFKREQH